MLRPLGTLVRLESRWLMPQTHSSHSRYSSTVAVRACTAVPQSTSTVESWSQQWCSQLSIDALVGCSECSLFNQLHTVLHCCTLLCTQSPYSRSPHTSVLGAQHSSVHSTLLSVSPLLLLDCYFCLFVFLTLLLGSNRYEI